MGCSLFVMGGLFVAVFFWCGIFVGILVLLLAAVAAAAFVVLLQESAEVVLLRLLAYPNGLLLIVEDAQVVYLLLEGDNGNPLVAPGLNPGAAAGVVPL